MQFSLRDLLEYTAWCGLLSACTAIAGIGSGMGLMLFALALWLRQGGLALAMLTFSMLATGATQADPSGPIAEGRFLLVLLLAAALCGWYARRHSGRANLPPDGRPLPLRGAHPTQDAGR